MRHRLLLFLCTLGVHIASLSAQQVTEFEFGDSGWNNPQKIWQMPDGNLAVVAARYNGNAENTKLYHFNPVGQTLATFNLPDQNEGFNFLEVSADGTTFRTGGFNNTGYVVRTINLQGVVLDSFTYLPQDAAFGFFAVKGMPNGDLVLAYGNQETPAGVRVTRFTPQGAVVYSKYITTTYPDFYPSCLTVTPDGRVIVLVVDFSYGYRVICLGQTGTQMWTKSFPAVPNFTEYLGLVTLDNGNVALFGQDGSNNGVQLGGYVGMYPISGPVIYNRYFIHDFPGFQPMTGFADGNQLILAGSYFDQSGFGLGVIKLDANGQTVFARKFNRLSGDGNCTANLTKNGDYVFSGFNWDQNGHGTNAYVLCLQADGTLNWKIDGGNALIRLMNGFYHLDNGDMVFTGQASQPQLPPGQIRNLLALVSGTGALYPHLFSGQVVVDSIANCLPDAGETGRSAWLVRAETPTTTRYATTDIDGRFAIRLDDQTAKISVLAPNAIWSPCSPSTLADFSDSDTVTASIPIKVERFCPALNIESSITAVRRCFDNTYYLSWCNNGSITAENLDLEIVLDSFFNFVNASIPLTGSNGQTLHFSPASLPGGQCASMWLTIHSSCDAPLGTLHCLSVKLSAGNACPSLAGGVAATRECQTSIGSFDPNDKRVFIADTLARGHVLANTLLTYQIRFQNTGTDTAFKVVIVDTLANTLDINTLRLGASSRPCTMQVSGERVVKFVFNNIMLPDSNKNEAASHGFVNFHIAQQPDLPVLTRIDNVADIYFDFNAPVRTNLQRLTVGDLSGVHQPGERAGNLILYPNPAPEGRLWVESLDPQQTIRNVRVYDSWGREISVMEFNEMKINVLLPDSPGLYFVRALSENGAESVWSVVR